MDAAPSIIAIQTKPVSKGTKTALTVTTSVGVFTRTTTKTPKFLVIVSPDIEANIRARILQQNAVQMGEGNYLWYKSIADGTCAQPYGVTVDDARERMASIEHDVATTEERIAAAVTKTSWEYISWNGRFDLALKEVNTKRAIRHVYAGRSFFIINIETSEITKA